MYENPYTADLEWFERFKEDPNNSGFAATCMNCKKTMRLTIDPLAVLDNCFCQPPVDPKDLAEAHGLSIFASMFTYARPLEDSANVS